MDQTKSIISMEIWGNTIIDIFVAFGIFVVAMITLTLFRIWIIRYLRHWTGKTENKVDDFALSLFERTLLPLFYVGSSYLAIMHLDLTPEADKYITVIAKIILIFQMVRMILALAVCILQNTWLKRESSRSTASKSILTVLRIFVWGVALVFLLDNLGFDVNSVIAGLGIGGVAVALAAQTILGDLFNYFVIFFDKPFREGDFVIIDEYLGVIEHIGIKSTRIRSLGGEQLVFSNSDLTSSRLRNYKRMQRRRVLFKLGVTYQTSSEKMQKAPEIVKTIINKVENTKFDRAHFSGFGDFSLNLEIVYYVMSADYNQYMDIQQDINLKIMKAFEDEGLEFAYPTQTLFVNK